MLTYHEQMARKGAEDARSDWRYRNSRAHWRKPRTARFYQHTTTHGFERAPKDEQDAYLSAYRAEWDRLRSQA